ncbi:hypothetical protein [uncultured Cellulomonas sp.]|uniref:hypothetical protein n=1 Tax=uncultured Cellulomonas sp. TaxID=189682 RepID=UPI002619D5DC|nr:hypothetical protein [uncultured Cellulomonas sp.]
MKHARRLRQQLDDWQQVWRQVEAMLDRLETARDEDDVPRRKTEALLAAAAVVERRRLAAGVTAVALGDPVVGRLPTRGWDPATGVEVPVLDAWAATVRPGRLPGTDELELAVADLETVSLPPPFEEVSGPLVLEQVRLPASRETLEVATDGAPEMLRVPSYPGGRTPIAPAGSVVLAGVATLFPAADRHAATTHVDTGEGPPPRFVGRWSALATTRRATLPALDEPPPYTTDAPTTGAPPLTSALLAEARSLVADVLDGVASRLPPGRHDDVAATLAAAAGSPGSAATDAADLRAAAQVLDEEGLDEEELDADDGGLVGALERAADAIQGSPAALAAVATAASALAAGLAGAPLGLPVPAPVTAARRAAAVSLDGALDALPGAGSLTGALAVPVESGALAREIDAVVAGRVAYPDGSLRILRTLEVAFARWWPSLVRWMALRCLPGGTLDRAVTRFLQPFVDGLAALVAGTDGGFAVDGLAVAGPVSLGGTLVPTDSPASLVPTLGRVVEAGQVAVLTGARPAAVVVLGVGRDGDRLALLCAPLRLSLAGPDVAPGVPGLVADGAAVAGPSVRLAAAELRRGRADDPARDGLVEQAVALHSELALLLGRDRVATSLGGAGVPDPSGPALQTVTWHGTAPASTAAFVLHGVPEAWWDRSGERPEPRLVRPGELVLLRGAVPPGPDGDPGDPGGGTVQTVVEVDRAVWLPGSMLGRVDLSRAAVLAVDPAALGDLDGPALLCGPRDDLVLVTVRRTWQATALAGPLTLRRDFAGFDLPSLAVGSPLGDALVLAVTGAAPRGPSGVDRELELAAATGLLDDWTRYTR